MGLSNEWDLGGGEGKEELWSMCSTGQEMAKRQKKKNSADADTQSPWELRLPSFKFHCLFLVEL